MWIECLTERTPTTGSPHPPTLSRLGEVHSDDLIPLKPNLSKKSPTDRVPPRSLDRVTKAVSSQASLRLRRRQAVPPAPAYSDQSTVAQRDMPGSSSSYRS